MSQEECFQISLENWMRLLEHTCELVQRSAGHMPQMSTCDISSVCSNGSKPSAAAVVSKKCLQSFEERYTEVMKPLQFGT